MSAPATSGQIRQLLEVLREVDTDGMQRVLANGDVLQAVAAGHITRDALQGVMPYRYVDLLTHYRINSFAQMQEHWLDYPAWYVRAHGAYIPMLEHYRARSLGDLRAHWMDYNTWCVKVSTRSRV